MKPYATHYIYIQGVQKSIVTDFYERQNEFVRDKIKIVPSVLNLCKVETPTALIDILSLGTKAVPHGQLSDYDNFYETYRFREYSMASVSFCFLLNFIYSIQPDMVRKIKDLLVLFLYQ